MNKAFRIRYDPRIPTWILDIHILFADWLAKKYEVAHPITVNLAHCISLRQDNDIYYGCFVVDCRERLYMDLACGRPRFNGHFPSRINVINVFLTTFAHEFCHYEQWRDGKLQTHKGVAKRAKTMVQHFLSEIRY